MTSPTAHEMSMTTRRLLNLSRSLSGPPCNRLTSAGWTRIPALTSPTKITQKRALVHGDMGTLPNTYPVRGELSVAVTLRHS